MNDAAAQQPADAVTGALVKILEDMTSDWDIDLSGPIDRDTRLIGDLQFESIDIVELVVAIEEVYKERSIPFEQLLMVDGRYVDDLTVGQTADFVARHV